MFGSYDLKLVALSLVVAAIASYTALDLAGRVSASRGRAAMIWLVAGAIAMGTGIWSMHFIGMLAFSLPPLKLAYDLPITLLSMVAAIAVSGLALHVIQRPKLTARNLSGGATLMGVGISVMHYTGMAAMRMSPAIEYDPRRVRRVLGLPGYGQFYKGKPITTMTYDFYAGRPGRRFDGTRFTLQEIFLSTLTNFLYDDGRAPTGEPSWFGLQKKEALANWTRRIEILALVEDTHDGTFFSTSPTGGGAVHPNEGAVSFGTFTYALSDQSIRLRFFSMVKQLTRDRLIRLCHLDYNREMALVAVRSGATRPARPPVRTRVASGGAPWSSHPEPPVLLRPISTLAGRPTALTGRGTGNSPASSSDTPASSFNWLRSAMTTTGIPISRSRANPSNASATARGSGTNDATRNIRLRNVPAGTYRLYQAPDDNAVGDYTAAQLRGGIDITLPAKQSARVLRIEREEIDAGLPRTRT